MHLEEFYKTPNLSTSFSELPDLISVYLASRWDLISDSLFAASFLVDPRWRSESLEEEDLQDAENVLRKLAGSNWPKIKDQIAKFRRWLGPFHGEVQPDEDPFAFWFWISSNKGYEEVAEIALFLLEFPMSSASVERSFSVIRHIHTWKRNRLGRERLATLTFVNINRNFKRKINRL